MFTEMKAEPIGGNLRTVIRVFRLFDYNRGGHIQQHEFRRILDSYLIQLTDKEFQRLWSHYSPNNKVTISYVLFLDKLGFGNSHNFNIAPVCTKLEVSGRQATPPEKVKQRPECIVPSVLPHRKLQTLFYDKMCVNSTPVWQALQAFDTTHSGLVKQDVLRAVLNSFIFPMNTHSFQKLTSQYGVKTTGPIRWKHFLGYFMSLGKEEADTDPHTDRTSEQPLQDKDNLDLQDFYPRLKEIFHQVEVGEVGWISRADLQHLLKRPDGSQSRTPQPHLHNTQITELLNILDPEHSGVIQLTSLERLNPSIPSAPSPCNTPEPPDEETDPTSTETVQQKTPDERQTTQWADKVSVASASWRTVESLLLEKLCEHLSSVLAALKLCDPQCTGYVKQEDLKRVLNHYGFPISDTHFNNSGQFFQCGERAAGDLLGRVDDPLERFPLSHCAAQMQYVRMLSMESRSSEVLALQVVAPAPCCQPLHLVPVGRLIPPRDEPHHCGVISKLHNGVAMVDGGTVMCVEGSRAGGSCSMECCGHGVVRGSVRSVGKLVGVKAFFGQGTMVEDFRQSGTVDCSRHRLKILVKTPASSSAQSLNTSPGTPSGPAAFLGLTARSVRLTSCSSTVRFKLGCGDAVPGGVTSKRAKKRFNSSARAVSPSAAPSQLLDLPAHPGLLVGVDPDAFVHSDSVYAVFNVAEYTVCEHLQVLMLCVSFSSSTPGSSSRLVSYIDLFRYLGAPLTDESTLSSCCYHTERSCNSPQSTLQSVRAQRGSQDTCSILDIVFKRMRSRLEQRHTRLIDRIQAIIYSCDGMLSEADIRKILEDNWIILDNENFNKFIELLGLIDGRMECPAFQRKYEEATARDGQQDSEGSGEKEVVTLLTSAEQCLAAMKTRIKIIHEDNLTAFRLMDRKRKGVVDCHDFRVLYNSLGFFCQEGEYQRLLELIGLQPGGNLNYTEFVCVVENKGKHGTQTATIQEQLHDLLACEARYKWADMSKILCHCDTVGQGWIYKKSLRELLYTYSLPLTSNEFEQLWLRYDPEGKGSVAVCDFLERLGFNHDVGHGQILKETVAQKDASRPVVSDTTSPECIEQVLQDNYKELSDALIGLERRGDGTVTVEELLNLFHSCRCFIQREQLIHHLHRFKVSMTDNNRRISYMDLLSVFNHKAEKKNEPSPSTPEANGQMESLNGLSPDTALVKMQELVTASAPNLFKAFSAFDQSSTGTVRALDFRQVLENFCARLSDKQFRHMLTRLELNSESCTVNWKDFLSKFQSQSPVMSERCLSRTRERPKTTSVVQSDTSGVTVVLQQIQEVVSGHLYELTKDVLDLDSSNSTTITKEHFRQLCTRHCPTLTNDQFECVWSQMAVKEQGKLQFREFLKRFGALGRTAHTEAQSPINSVPPPSPEPPETASTQYHYPNTAGATLHRSKSASQCSSQHRPSAGRPGTGSLPGITERRLRGAVQRCWKDIHKNCSQKDPQQEGHISAVSFLEILQSLNINVSQVQFERLAVKLNIMNAGAVSYHNFLRHFLLNLRPAETRRTFDRCKLPLPVTPMIHGVLSKDCVEVMLRIYEAVRSSWTSIRRSFLTSDRTRTGNVSVQDFRKVLLQFSVSLSEEEFFHLSSYYDANTAGEICYNHFLWAFLH
ncbi:EF-hand calcium-binding domain-containing protein 6-like [Scomber scombrus]|uniref:EF-hand calcium-binding domain-containing protein 6-like n=1 Tax=Scomber scombrus TaxID=13677 RepID=UPI002DDC39E0|nr:EF-hand calcium-binding domain-containing protein 6-like [Scomber scombrus]